MLGLSTLILNPDYSPKNMFPLKRISVEAAIVSVLTGDATCIKEHDRRVLTPSRTDLFWPSIIVEKQFHGKRHKDVLLKRQTLYYRDHGMCMYCGTELTEYNITCDHVMPRSKGGEHDWTNVVASCKKCNAAKDSSLPKGRWIPRIKPYTPTIFELNEKRKHFPIVVDDKHWIDYIGGATGWKGEVIVRRIGAT